MDFNELPDQNSQANKTKSRLTMLAMAAVFIAPVLLAYLAYFGGWFEGGTKNKGELIKQPWHLDDLSIQSFSFGEWGDSHYMAKWNWLLIMDQSSCDELCQINWFLLQQTQLGLAKNSEKVSYLLVLNQNTQSLHDDWKKIDFAKAEITDGFIKVQTENMKGFNTKPLPANAIYLMDPLGNVFMRYSLISSKEQAPLKSKDLRTDLSRVLRYLDVSKKHD